MALDIAKELAAMRRMTVSQLRARYVEVFGESTRSSNRQHLIRRIAWRLQALEEGSLSDRAVRRAAELADDAQLRLTAPRNIPQSIPLKIPRSGTDTPPVRGFYSRESPEPRTSDAFRDRRLPPPGNVIARVYKGRHLRVTVLEDGFEYEGLQYRSLSAVAKAITGSHLNGYAFFKLGPERSTPGTTTPGTTTPGTTTPGTTTPGTTTPGTTTPGTTTPGTTTPGTTTPGTTTPRSPGTPPSPPATPTRDEMTPE